MSAVGLVIAAGGIAAANETLFAPVNATTGNIASSFNWRIVPATAVLALTLGALENASPAFANGIAGLVLLSVLIVPTGNAPSPLDNVTKTLGL